MAEAKQTLVERLFAERRGALQAFFRRRPGCRLDATDLAQEVYLRMLRVADTDAIRDLEAYLFGMASHVAKEHAAVEWRRGRTVDVMPHGLRPRRIDHTGHQAVSTTGP